MSKCDDYIETSEDQCLNNCLIRNFTEEFDCLHVRLRLMDLENETLQIGNGKMTPCLLHHLQNKTFEYKQKISLKIGNMRNNIEEFGLVRIKQMLASFNSKNLYKRYCTTLILK